MRIYRLDMTFRRLASMAISASIVATLGSLPVQVAQAADTIQTLATAYLPTISESVDASGFKHPGMGFSKAQLENMRTQVRAQQEPWNTYFNQMLLHSGAAKSITIRNVDSADPTKPRYYGLASQGMNSLFIADSVMAYTQAILYFVTGDETYRANAMRIIRLYAKMDPAQYAYFVDSHIHTGIPLSRMLGAAEILRYTSTQTPALAWTDDDTVQLTNNLVHPVVHIFNSCNCRFMNQHLYTTLAAMSGAIFAQDREEYNKTVEWFTVNKDAVDQGQTGAIKRLFRMVTRNDMTGEEVPPTIQHVEMGRDQAHGAGDIVNAGLISRLLISQGTKVDPVDGTASTAPNAVGPYEFLEDRILNVAEIFSTFMLGHEIPWVPTASHTDEFGTPTIWYKKVSSDYRGRTSQSNWEPFYYYQYVRGLPMEQRAPNYTTFYSKRTSYGWGGNDGGDDFWMLIPAEAAQAEGGKYLVKPITDPVREVEDRFTALDSDAIAMQDGDAKFVRITATPAGSKFVVFSYAAGASNYGLRIRTNGIASIDLYGKDYLLPDTQGQWRYVIFPGNVNDFLPFIVKGSGTQVDIDHINVKSSTLLTPPVFTIGSADLTINSYAGTTLTTTLDCAATDPGAGEVVTYQADNLPQGASFNTTTGAFSWKPTQAGTYAFFVGASDGTTVTMKRVTFVVDADRQAAVDRANAQYKPAAAYVASTLPAYNAAYADMMSVIGSADDAVYFQKLATLRSASAALQELNPLLPDGSLDFTNMFFASDFGTSVRNLIDGNQDSAAGLITDDKDPTRLLVLGMDFGAGFKMAANEFQVQTVAGFPERIGGVAIFGSNDKETWTRLTPVLTTRDDELQTVKVQEDLKTAKFRFMRLHMLEPFKPVYQPWAGLHMAELRIFGTRTETINSLSSVSVSSDQALKKRIVAGNTVKLSFKATEPISNVNVTILGRPATATTIDNLNWTATTVVTGTDVGEIKFRLNYKTAQGLDAEEVLFTTDASSLFIADTSNYIGDLLSIVALKDSSNRSPAELSTMVNRLFDSNLLSGTDFRVNNSGAGGWVMFDFKEGGQATLSKVEVIGNQDNFSSRINGTVVQGSNDTTSWQDISSYAGNTADWQTLTVNGTQPYRYVRMYNANTWFGNMTELRFHGVAVSTNRIASASISSPEAMRNRIVPGNTVNVNFKAKEAINSVNVTIQGQAATVTTADNVNFKATAVMPQGVAVGAVKFAIAYKLQDGKDGLPNTLTSDNTNLVLVDESDVIRNVRSIATLIDTTSGRTAATTLAMVDKLFDSNLGSISDFRLGTNGTGGSITFDFKAGNQVNLSNVEIVNAGSLYPRIKWTVVMGSNDNATWTELTPPTVSTQEWQTLPVSSRVPYRYIRLWNSTAWFGNMSEVRFHGSVHAADTTVPVTTDNAPTEPPIGNATITLTATDASTGIAATYYTVNGGAQQTGNTIALTTSGTHTLVYWSVDWAGNVEPKHTVTVIVRPVDVSTSVKMVQHGTSLNRATGKYVGSVTVTNTSGSALTGPLQLKLSALTAGVTLDNASAYDQGSPYITVPGTLNAGASISVPLTFTNPARSVIGYTPVLYKGSF
jgi:hypothetical protein